MEFLKTKEMVDQCVHNMGIDYMSLNSVCKGEGAYSFYYTRTYHGLQETYVDHHIGTTTTGTDGSAIMMSLWKPEYLYIEVQNGEVVKVRWENLSVIKNIDNQNVQALSWDEIKEIFITQMDYLLLPDDISNKMEIHIKRIELGLTKVLMKHSYDDYQLIPTWSFLGYDQKTDSGSENIGAQVCFLTINAIDGTVIDRGLMY